MVSLGQALRILPISCTLDEMIQEPKSPRSMGPFYFGVSVNTTNQHNVPIPLGYFHAGWSLCPASRQLCQRFSLFQAPKERWPFFLSLNRFQSICLEDQYTVSSKCTLFPFAFFYCSLASFSSFFPFWRMEQVTNCMRKSLGSPSMKQQIRGMRAWKVPLTYELAWFSPPSQCPPSSHHLSLTSTPKCTKRTKKTLPSKCGAPRKSSLAF